MREQTYKNPHDDLSMIDFGDKRLTARLEKTVKALSQRMCGSILGSCETRHDAKAFYALLSNDKFSFSKIIEKAQKETSERIKNSGITEVLLPQDTTDINLNGREKTEGLGYSSNKTKGIKLHSSLALTSDGVCLGLASQQYKTRESKKMELPENEKANRPIEEKESFRWLETARESIKTVPTGVTPIIICDREGDFYELYAEMLSLKASFVVRVGQNRATAGGQLAVQQIKHTRASGTVKISIPRNSRKNTPARTAEMEVAYRSVTVTKPKRAGKGLPRSLELQLIRITETDCPDGAEPVEWILMTNMPLSSPEDTLRAVEYYVHRWKIERFHFVLKSGCQAEKIQQRTYERILPVLFIYSVIAAFILGMTYFARNQPDAPCDLFLDEDEWKILYRLITRKPAPPDKPYSIKTAVSYLGELGGFKHNKSDGDYGVKAIWRGLVRLFDALDVVRRLMGQG